MQRVVFTGPESSGKSTLAEPLAAHFAVPQRRRLVYESGINTADAETATRPRRA